MTRVALVGYLAIAACSSSSSNGGGAVDGGLPLGTDGGDASVGAASIEESCAKFCQKKLDLHCANDTATEEQCESGCVGAQATNVGCEAETRAFAACEADGKVICSVDGKATPVEPCGDETRAAVACYQTHPSAPVDASRD